MPDLGWSQCTAVESIPGKVSGAWVFADTRLPVATIFENLEDLSSEEVVEQFDVTREQIQAVLDFVAQSLRASSPAQPERQNMLILFDHGTAIGLARQLAGHTVRTAKTWAENNSATAISSLPRRTPVLNSSSPQTSESNTSRT